MRKMPMNDKENSGPVRGSGDFLADRGYDDPEEMRVKFALANNIALTIEDRNLRQVDVAALAGLAQADVSRIVNGIVKDYSVFRLMRVLAALGKDVSIGVTDASCGRGAIIAPDVAPGSAGLEPAAPLAR
jgi:predicted XRE-type DNA-binding protein